MENIKTVVHKNFTRLMKSSGMKPKDVIQSLKVDKATYSRWQSGESSPDITNIDRLASLWGVEPLEFFVKEEPVKKAPPISYFLKRVSSIPDEIYDLAADLGSDHPIWDVVKGVLEAAKEGTVESITKKNLP